MSARTLLAAMLLAGCIGPTIVRTPVREGDVIVATSTNNISYIVDARTQLCFFVYAGESGAQTAPSGVAQVPCERLLAIPELRERLSFLKK